MNKKILKSKKVAKGMNAYDCILSELQVLQRLEHPHIIFLHEIIDDDTKDNIYLVTEYHSNGSLEDIISKRNEKYEKHNQHCKK